MHNMHMRFCSKAVYSIAFYFEVNERGVTARMWAINFVVKQHSLRVCFMILAKRIYPSLSSLI